MKNRQQRIDQALQQIIPIVKREFVRAGIWLGVSCDYDENVIYFGDDSAIRLFWHDPTDQYVCQYEKDDRWLHIANGDVSFVNTVVQVLLGMGLGEGNTPLPDRG